MKIEIANGVIQLNGVYYAIEEPKTVYDVHTIRRMFWLNTETNIKDFNYGNFYLKLETAESILSDLD